MRHQFARQIIFAIALALSVSLCFDQASAQKRRNKRSRRITNPVTVTPVQPTTTTSTEPQIISTADQQTSDQNNSSDVNDQSQGNSRRMGRRRAAAAEPESNEGSVQRTVNELSTKVTNLSDKLNQVEQHLNLDLLLRAEQRVDTLRTQLSDTQAKQAEMQARMEQIDFDLQPENIEHSVATYGTTHPEEARAARKRALESEKKRTQAQLDLMQTSLQRLESAIASADAEVEKLRKRVDEATTDTQTNAGATGNTNNTEGTTTTEPATPTTNNPPTTTTPPQP